MTIREKVARALMDEGFVGLGIEDIAIIAFLEAAAEDGWHIWPDEATEEMLNSCPQAQSRGNVGRDRYRALRAASPEFKWNK